MSFQGVMTRYVTAK